MAKRLNKNEWTDLDSIEHQLKAAVVTGEQLTDMSAEDLQEFLM